MPRKTKIICTLGPSTADENILSQLIINGMNVARFNFSHADHASHKKTFDKLVELREKYELPVAALLDTKGPEIRICSFKEGKVQLKKGDTFTLTTNDVEGDNTIVSITYKDLIKDIEVGKKVLLDDGLIEMTVIHKSETDIVCKVENDGFVSNNKGVNVPGTKLSMPFVSQKDREDIIFGIKTGFDFIAASFTRSADDILQIRRILDEYDCHKINIIAKIENKEGVDNIDEILHVSDGVMVARGDMGVEIPLEDVPVMQKMLIKKAYNAGKQVITATQMLDSMMKNPRPTRAESTDVANAIYDGTSAIMLSGETAAGLYPVEALKTMVKIAHRTEHDIDYSNRLFHRVVKPNSPDVTNAISHATCTTAIDLGAKAIVTVTKSGATARMISKFRPAHPIIGCTTYDYVARQLNLSWGVTPVLIKDQKDTDTLFDHAVDAAETTKLVESGDLVVITAGVPLGISGTTNLMKVQVVGHVLVTGKGITSKSICASLCVCKNSEEAFQKFDPGDILVIPYTDNSVLPLLKQSAGIITEQGGINSHAAIVGLTMDIPVIVGAENATDILKSGSIVSVDCEKGIVSSK